MLNIFSYLDIIPTNMKTATSVCKTIDSWSFISATDIKGFVVTMSQTSYVLDEKLLSMKAACEQDLLVLQ